MTSCYGKLPNKAHQAPETPQSADAILSDFVQNFNEKDFMFEILQFSVYSKLIQEVIAHNEIWYETGN